MESKKGISLIVLVITIIVIIILAVAVILTIANNNPIENARKARFLNDLSAIQDEVTLEIAKQVVDSQGSYKVEDFNVDDLKNLSTVKAAGYGDRLTVTNGKIGLLASKFIPKEVEWAENEGYTISGESGESETAESDPPIPTGFTHTEGTIETGYVIKNDTDDNEFVWIPVDDISDFVREDGWVNNSKQTWVSGGNATEPYSYNGATANATETAEYNAMISSVEEYKGFYIARYEASQSTDGKAKSIKGKMPWVSIGWNNDSNSSTRMQTQTGGAVEKARAVYPVASATTGSAVSTLVYGVQWDRAVNYITDNDENKKKDSRTFGNHKDSESFEYTKEDGTTGTKTKDTSVKIPTGSTTRNQLKNVYDMAGNVLEWTMEAYNSIHRVYRGGSCTGSGVDYPVSSRGSLYPNSTYGDLGFRVALYIAE